MNLSIISSTVKHIQGEPVYIKKNLKMVGAKGERIAFQVVLLGEYHNVSVSVVSEYHTEIFWEKYVTIDNPSSGLNRKGKYPDIMLDLTTAEQFGENSSETEDGILWCFVDIPEELNEKQFQIKLNVKADEGEDYVIAEVEVFDFCLPKENHNRTLFLIRSDMIKGNTTSEIEGKYYLLSDELLKYRLSPGRPIPEFVNDTDKIVEQIKKLVHDDRCAAYAIPYTYYREDTIYEKGQPCLDIEMLKRLLILLIEQSSDEDNLLNKACFYIGFIDEPEPKNFHRVIRVCREIYDLKRELVRIIDFSSKRDVERSLLTMDNIVTSFIKEPLYGAVDTWCPTYWAYYKPEYVYEENKIRGVGRKNWWYGCISPWTPFPNLHTDSQMKDHRLEGWLRYKYNIGGNLYWAVNLTKKYDSEKHSYIDCDILNEAMLFPGACGDGILFYTETKYNKILPSLRVFSMFLGLEEYEYFWLLDNAAKDKYFYYKKTLDMRKSLSGIFDRVSQGTFLLGDFDLEELRRELGELVILAQNGIFVFSRHEDSNYILEIYSPYDAKIDCCGATLLSQKRSGKGKIRCYSFTAECERYAEIHATVGTKELKANYFLGRKRVQVPFAKVKVYNGVKLIGRGKKRNVYLSPFVEEEEPKIVLSTCIPEGNQIDRVYCNVQSFSDEAFILGVNLIDAKGNRYKVGYDVVKENSMNEISIAVSELMQNELNKYPIYDVDLNRRKSMGFLFNEVHELELVFSNNVKLLDDNRERKSLEYRFYIDSISISLI